MTLMKDLAWVALIVLCLPLLMAAALVAVLVIMARSLYLWASGNLSSTSKSAHAPAIPAASWWASWRARANGRDSNDAPSALPASLPVPAYATDGRRPRR